MATLRRVTRVFGLTAVLAAWAAHAQPVIDNAPASVRLGNASPPLRVVMSGTTAGLAAMVSVSDGGEVGTSADPASPSWGPTLSLAAATPAPVFYVRARSLAPVHVTASAVGATATRVLAVDPLVFSDGMETLTLMDTDAPKGAWDSALKTAADSGISASMLAAHRGRGGMRVVDGDETTAVFTTVVTRFAPLDTDVHARLWARIAPTNATSTGRFAVFGTGFNTGTLLGWVGARRSRPGGVPQDDVQLGGDSVGAAGRNLVDEERPGFADGGWHLVELSLVGLRSDAGQREVRVDGQRLAARRGLDWSVEDTSDWRPRRLQVGSAFTEAGGVGMTGVYDFDDVRISGTAPASTVVFRDSGVLLLSTCNPVRVGLADSMDGGAAPAPYDVELSLGADGGTFCDGGVRIAAGASEVVALYRPAQPRSVAFAGDLGADFLPTTAELSAVGFIAQVSPGEQTVAPGATATLDTSASRHADGRSISRWAWRLVRAPTHLEVDAGVALRVSPQVPGLYEFEVQVGDATELSAPVAASIVVSGTSGPPTDKIGGCYCGDAGSLLAILGSALWMVRLGRLRRGAGKKP